MLSLLKKYPYWFAFLAILILQSCIILITGFNGYFGQDSYEYLKTTREIHAYYLGGSKPTYSVFPGMYAIVCSLFMFVFPNAILLLQVVSMLSLFFVFYFLRKVLILLFDKDKYIDAYLFLFLVLSPYLLRFSIISMSDMFGIALWVASLYFALKFQKLLGVKYLLLCVLFAGASVMTRYTAIIVVIPIAFICLQTLIKNKKIILLFPAFIVFVLSSLPDFILRQRLFFWDFSNSTPAFSYFYFLDQYHLSNFFKRDFYNLDGWQHYAVPNIIYVFEIFIHPAFIFVGTLFLVFVNKERLKNTNIQFIIGGIIFYLLFLAGNAYQGDRYLMFVLPYVLILYYPVFLYIINKFEFVLRFKYVLFWGILVVQLGLFFYSFKVILQTNRNEQEIGKYMAELPQNIAIFTFSLDGPLHMYNDEVKIFDIYSNVISNSISEGYLLFNYSAFSEQFEGLNPMLNYRYLESNYSLKAVKEFDLGWKLYSIQ